MKPTRLIILGCAIAAAFVAPALRAADADPADDHLRTELRDTTLQLRSVQSELAEAQAQQAAAAAERDALAATVVSLRKQSAAASTSSQKAAADLQSQIEALKAENSRLGDSLFVAKSQNENAGRDNQEAGALNARMRSEIIVLTRKVADLQSKNLALFLTGNEILTRYQEFGLGTAISAKEPFVGSTRTKLENLVQDYQDKLADERAHN